MYAVSSLASRAGQHRLIASCCRRVFCQRACRRYRCCFHRRARVTSKDPRSSRAYQARAQKGKEIGSAGKEPRLVAISKLHPPSAILAAHKQADQLHFGENYVQEM